jgi:hypothetical protein
MIKLYVAVSSPERRKNHGIKRVKRPIEIVGQFKYLGKTVTKQNFIHEEIKKRFLLLLYYSRFWISI